MRDARKHWLYRPTDVACTVYFRRFHDVHVHDAQYVPHEGPVLLLAKHQTIRDIPLEATLLRNHFTDDQGQHVKRRGYWILRDNLPRILQYWGGLRIKRDKERKKELKVHVERAASLAGVVRGDPEYLPTVKRAGREWKEKNRRDIQNDIDVLGDIWSRGEVITSHPEGTRNMGVVGKVHRGFFDMVAAVEQKYGLSIPAYPVGIQYAVPVSRGSRIDVRFGPQVGIHQEGIQDTLAEILRELSGISSSQLVDDK